MTLQSNEVDESALSPDDAFAVLGDETRIEILQTLGEADAPLSFSELREHVGTSDSGQFNYHLNKLKGHFIRKADIGYMLSQAGTRMVEAVLSGAVTEAPHVGLTEIDASCHYCGAPIAVIYREPQTPNHRPSQPRRPGRGTRGSRRRTTGSGAAGRRPVRLCR